MPLLHSPVMVTERVGVFGGTFDPVHVGHLTAACAARHQLALDRVLLVVAADPWQKRGHVVAAAEDRFAMVAAACEGVGGLEASRLEIDRGGPTYTADTLAVLARPGRELFLVLGADAAAGLDSWARPDEVRARATLAVVGRNGSPALPAGAVAVTMPQLDVSATDLRRRVAAGEPVDFLVPAPALMILRARRLYTGAL